MEARLFSTKQIALRLGFTREDGTPNPQAFLSWVKGCQGFPIPLRKHHKWWDFKAIEQWLDKQSGIVPESVDYDDVIRRRLNNGKIQDGLRC